MILLHCTINTVGLYSAPNKTKERKKTITCSASLSVGGDLKISDIQVSRWGGSYIHQTNENVLWELQDHT